jgi:hypothetical protein
VAVLAPGVEDAVPMAGDPGHHEHDEPAEEDLDDGAEVVLRLFSWAARCVQPNPSKMPHTRLIASAPSR